MLAICADCTTAYAPELTLCPHCGSERRSLEETDPLRGGTEPMPKITRHGGPTIAGATWEPGEQEPAEPEPETGPATEPCGTRAAWRPNDEIREWAWRNGFDDLSSRGRIPANIREAFDAAHAPEPDAEPAET